MDLKTVKFILTTTFLVIVAALIIGSFTNNQLLIYIMLAFFVVFALVYSLMIPLCYLFVNSFSQLFVVFVCFLRLSVWFFLFLGIKVLQNLLNSLSFSGGGKEDPFTSAHK